MKIGIILLNYNGLKDTQECLESLVDIEVAGHTVKVWIIDYGEENQVKELEKVVTEHCSVTTKTPWQHQIIRKEENLGFAGGNNVGIKEALEWQADYICLLNNDTLVAKDFLIQLVKSLDSHQDWGCVSSKIYFAKGYEFHKDRYSDSEKGKVIWYAGGLIDWDNLYASHRGVDEVDNGQFDKAEETEFMSGCAVLIRSEVLKKVSLLDEKLFLYWEDTDLSMRIKRENHKVGYEPKSIVWHKNAGGSGVGSNLHNYFLTRNRLWFGFHYAPFRTKLALLRQSLLQLLTLKDPWMRKGIVDYFLGNMGKGSFFTLSSSRFDQREKSTSGIQAK